ncbi:hypothetical protein L596_002123 [Steinernema carpocapsae]|uniref:Uncharacterized protein n=1 Tax=Steinernema carpocapsae TaxID=34508 RepID=A0A4U8UQX8_STECR|nr:hypothetical protein L596_002123 [Steinernema carpocapsae]
MNQTGRPSIVDRTSLKDGSFTNRSLENCLIINPIVMSDHEEQRPQEEAGPPKIGPVGRSSVLRRLATFIPDMQEANRVMVPLAPLEASPFEFTQCTQSGSESDDDSDTGDLTDGEGDSTDEPYGVMEIAVFKDATLTVPLIGAAVEYEDRISTKLPLAFHDVDALQESQDQSKQEDSTVESTQLTQESDEHSST